MNMFPSPNSNFEIVPIKNRYVLFLSDKAKCHLAYKYNLKEEHK